MAENGQMRWKVTVITDDSSRLAHLIKALGRDFYIDLVDTHSYAEAQTPIGLPDLIIVDSGGSPAPGIFGLLRDDEVLEKVPVVLLSDDHDGQMAGLEMGAVDCLHRSVHPELLRSKVRIFIERQQAEDGLRRSEQRANARADELESIMEMVVHDLRSPVLAIEGFVRVLERRVGSLVSDPGVKKILTQLANGSRAIKGFLMDLSRALSISPEQVELELNAFRLDEAVEELVEQYREEIEGKRIRVRLDMAGYHLPTVCDRRRIIQVLDNLLVNAIRHMGEVEQPAIRIELEDTRDYVIARIRDNGIGVPPEYRKRVFQRFFQVPHHGPKSGTGLGLAIAKAIVERHGGEIWLEPEADRGATFVFTLPRPIAGKSPQGH